MSAGDLIPLLLASSSAGKLAELRESLRDLPCRVGSFAEAGLTLPEVAEDGATFRENAVEKALAGCRATAAGGVPEAWVLADDSGLVVDALGGAPGVRSARFAGVSGSGRDAANNELLLARLQAVPDEGRGARFVCVLAVAAGGTVQVVAEGRAEGRILAAARGRSGFGYDPLFLHPASGRTFAEMSAAEKSAVSHRGAALRDLAPRLAARLAACRR